MAYFLVVEVPDAGSAMTQLSHNLPDTVLEVVLAAPTRADRSVAAICDVRGGTGAQRKLMIEGLRGADPEAKTLKAPGDSIRLALRFPVVGLAPVWKAIARFAAAHGLGSMWATLEDGVTFLRILAPATDVDHLADLLRQALQGEGLDADVATEAVQATGLVSRLTALNDALGAFARGAPEGF